MFSTLITTGITTGITALRRVPRAAWLLAFVVSVVLPALPVLGASAAPAAALSTTVVDLQPTRIVFHPDTEATRVELHNVGTTRVRAENFRIEGADWAGFAIVEGLDAQTIDPGQMFSFHVSVDGSSFKDAKAYRSGGAELRLTVGGERRTVPLVFENPSWIWTHFIPALIKIHLIALGFVLPLASLLTWLERKQSAMMQDRVGPNMARIQVGGVTLRLWGLLHIATDGIKMLFKEDFVPRRAHVPLYTLAPLMALCPVIAVFAIIPFGDALCYGRLFEVVTQADVDQCAAGRGGTPLQIAKIDVGLLFYFAIASLATYGTTLAGWASYNKWAVLGALRASAQMISYEVALGLTVVGALLVYGSLEPHALVHAQLDTYWGIVLQPLAFVLFFTAAVAETKRAPFDLPEGESEIIGYFIEYSGMRFGLFFLAEFMEVIFVGAMVTTLFLGGWSLPFGLMGASGFVSDVAALGFFVAAGAGMIATGVLIAASNKAVRDFGRVLTALGIVHVLIGLWAASSGWGTAMPHILVVVIGMTTWGIKVFALCWLQLLIRWTLPRFRYDQLMGLGWKGLLPLSVANIVLTAIVVYAMMPSTGSASVTSTTTATQGDTPPATDREHTP